MIKVLLDGAIVLSRFKVSDIVMTLWGQKLWEEYSYQVGAYLFTQCYPLCKISLRLILGPKSTVLLSADDETNMAFNEETAKEMQKQYQDSQARQIGKFNYK